jgi:microcystin-dependent protein
VACQEKRKAVPFRFSRKKANMFTGILLAACLVAAIAALLLGVTGGTGAESYNLPDANMQLTLAGPAAASSTVVSSAGFDTGETTALAFQSGDFEWQLTAPALSATILPNGDTMTTNIVAADNAAMSTNLTVLASIVQTGAGGAGAASASIRYRLPSVCQRFIGIQTVSGSGTTTAAGVSATLNALF